MNPPLRNSAGPCGELGTTNAREFGQKVRDIATVRANGGIASPERIESFGGRRPPAALATNCHSLP